MGKKRRAREAKLQQQLTLYDALGASGRDTIHKLMAPPAQTHSQTSMAAANSVKESAPILREKVLAHIRYSDDGLTDEEISRVTGIPPNTARPRRVELVRAGKVQAISKRKTSSGSLATVWGITPTCEKCGYLAHEEHCVCDDGK